MGVTRLNMISSVYYFHILLPYFLSSILVVYSIDNHYLINKISGPHTRERSFWFIMYTVVALPLGMRLASMLWQVNPKKFFQSYTEKPMENYISERDSFLRVFLYSLSVIAMLGIAYTFFVVRQFPLLSLFQGAEGLVLAVMRNEVGREFGGIVIIRDLFGIILTPIMSYVAYGYWKVTKSRFDKWWFYILFVSSILILTYNLAKAPVIYYLLGFIYFKVYNNIRISKKRLFLIGGLSFVLLSAFYFVVSSTFDIDLLFALNHGPLGRLFITQSSGLYLTVDTFPSHHDFLGFASISETFSNAFGLDHSQRSARIIMENYRPDAVRNGIAGVMNSLFVAEAYANFALAGVIISPFYVGMIIQSFYLLLMKLKKSPVVMAILVYYSLRSVINGGINDYIYNPVITVLMTVFFLTLISARLFSSKPVSYTQESNVASS